MLAAWRHGKRWERYKARRCWIRRVAKGLQPISFFRSVITAQPSPTKDPGTRTITQFWHETFDHFASTENGEGNEKNREESKGDENKEHEGVRPQKIEGIGQASYWLGNPMGGILYVLKNDRMLRISFGGPGSANDKLAKSKALAQKALGRL
jgi:hypothetical protein